MKNSKLNHLKAAVIALTLLSCTSKHDTNLESSQMTSENLSQEISINERNVPLEGAFNCRDLGGLLTKDGRTIKKGLLFRCGDLADLTSNDISTLEKLRIHTIVDFRSPREIELKPNKKISNVQQVVNLPTMAGDVDHIMENFEDMDLSDFLVESNQSFVRNPAYVENYKKFFALAQDAQQAPLLFHCTAGKDRTGFATAMLLYALGVDEESIFDDYLYSNTGLKDKNAKIIKVHPEYEAVLGVRKEYLQAAFDAIKEDYGSVDNFLKKALNADVAKLKSIYINN